MLANDAGYISIYVCMHACMYVCMYVCMYTMCDSYFSLSLYIGDTYIYIYIHLYLTI